MSMLDRLAILLFTALAAFIGGHFHGRAGQIEQHQLDQLQAQVGGYKIRVEQAEARAEGEKALREAEYTALSTHLQEKDRAHQTTERLVADLRADNRRLRIPVRMPTCPAAVPGGSTEPGVAQEGYADLTAGAAEWLVRLVQRGDDAIRKHAAVVDSYDRLAAACAAPLPTTTQEPPNGEN